MSGSSILTIPQPGAVQGSWQDHQNGCPPNEILGPPGWPPLPGNQAVNFVDGTPEAVMLTTRVVRVWGGSSWEFGGYWNGQPFATAAAFYGEDAVMLSWNAGTYLVEIDLQTMLGTGSAGVPAWYGSVATQPADDIAGNPLPDWYLPGGSTQYYIQYPGLPFSNEPTNWMPASPQASFGTAPVPDPASVGSGPEAHHALAALVDRLGDAIGRGATAAFSAGVPPDTFHGQAARLYQAAGDIRTYVANLPDPDARAHLRAVAASLVGIGRYIEPGSLSGPAAAEVGQLLDAVVGLAYRLATEG